MLVLTINTNLTRDKIPEDFCSKMTQVLADVFFMFYFKINYYKLFFLSIA